MVWIETPTKTSLRIADLGGPRRDHPRRRGPAGRQHVRAPCLERPLRLEADVVVTPLLSTSEATPTPRGERCTSEGALAERLAFRRNATGDVRGPFDCWPVLRGLKPFALRMERHCANAGAVAREEALRAVKGMSPFLLGELLGGVESLIELSAATTHASLAGSPFAVSDILIRLSVGMEAVEDPAAALG